MCQGVFLLVLIYDDKVVELEIDFPLSPVPVSHEWTLEPGQFKTLHSMICFHWINLHTRQILLFGPWTVVG